MVDKCSAVQPILWNWVIEALANFEHVDISTLIGLVNMAPAISGDMGKDAREMVSLRILESLFGHGNEAVVDTDSSQNAKISFDPSECFEDVLQQILHETPELMVELEKGKWDVRSFIMHKRASLPKCLLKRLKEAILESSHPLLVSLKERSKLVTANVFENTSPTVDGYFDAQTRVAKDDLASANPGKDKKKFQGNLLQEAEQVGNSTGGTAEQTGREDCKILKDRPLEGSNGIKWLDHDEHAASEKLLHNCDIANAQHDQQQLHRNDDKMPQNTCREEHDKGVSIGSSENLDFVGKLKDPKNSIQPNALFSGPSSKTKSCMEHDGQLETRTDRGRSDDESMDIAAKKETLLNSQCTLSQDSLSMTDWTEINLCVKCNKGGQLLVCSSEACLLQVHESCLGSDAALDENGVFICPFCAYYRAISEYREAKRKASLARKDLQAFCSLGVERRPNKFSMKRCGLEKNEVRRTKASGETTKGNGNGDAMVRDNVHCMSNKEDSAPAAPLISVNDDPSGEEEGAAVTSAENLVRPEHSRSCVNNDSSCGDMGVSLANQSMTEAEEVGQKFGDSPTRMGKHQLPSQAVSNLGPRSPSFKGNESDLVGGEHADTHIQTGCLNPQTKDLSQNPISQPNTPKQTCKEKAHMSIESSSHSRSLRKRKPQYTPPAVPSSRRKILKWTKSEEEILKEGVQRYSSANNKGIPWMEILDFGRNVFHKGRTPIDLKDKWRNLCKGSPKLK